MDTIPFSSIYNNYGIATGLSGSYSIDSLSTIYNSVSGPTSPQSLGAGYIANDIFSSNYKQGSAGWKLSYNGDFEAGSGSFRGDISGATGHFTGQVDVNSLIIGTNAYHIDSSGNTWWGNYATYATAVSGGAVNISSAGAVNFTTGNFSGTLASGIMITSPTITGGTIRTAASGARVEMSAANNRLDIYNSTPTNIGWFGGAGSNGNFMYISQPNTSEDYPPIYVTSAQASNIFNIYQTNSNLANRPAFRLESNNAYAGSVVMYLLATGSGATALIAQNTSNTYATVELLQGGTADVLHANGGSIDSSGVWHDNSSVLLKENFEDVSVLDKLLSLDIKKYNYISSSKKDKEGVKNILINQKKRENYIKNNGQFKGTIEEDYSGEKLSKEENDEIISKLDEEYIKETKREVRKYISPMAEDFYALFGVGDNKSITPKDLASVSLQAIKELNEKVVLLEQKLKDK